MEIINGTSLSNLCDYSFGDHLGGMDPIQLKGGFMKYANSENAEFIEKCKEFEGKTMTLFIDNIRLYNNDRTIECKESDAPWIKHLLETNDLLKTCGKLKKNKFVIFTSHEDTPICDKIDVPDNVLGVHAVNAEFFNDKVHPFPYGVQRPINRTGGDVDNRISVLKSEIDQIQHPTKLLYINCGIERHPDRQYFTNFEGLSWTTTRFDKDSMYFPYSKYRDFLLEMRDHKFMLCPLGHGMDCHRNWELLYMRRVPVMKDHPYFRKLMSGFPVLFVQDWSEITEDFLVYHEYLYKQAQKINMNSLDLSKIYTAILASYEWQ